MGPSSVRFGAGLRSFAGGGQISGRGPRRPTPRPSSCGGGGQRGEPASGGPSPALADDPPRGDGPGRGRGRGRDGAGRGAGRGRGGRGAGAGAGAGDGAGASPPPAPARPPRRAEPADGGAGAAGTAALFDICAVERALAAAAAHGAECGYRPMSFAAVDGAGHLMYVRRSDGALLLSPGVAHRKAYTAAVMKMPTEELQEAASRRPLFYDSFRDVGSAPLWAGGAGGVPICSRAVVVGGVGASGGTPEQDMECLEVGLRAAGLRRGRMGKDGPLCYRL